MRSRDENSDECGLDRRALESANLRNEFMSLQSVQDALMDNQDGSRLLLLALRTDTIASKGAVGNDIELAAAHLGLQCMRLMSISVATLKLPR